ncbi:MAG: hypothetical protein Q8Q59_12750 [Luteolibacter sp.]|jgi:hypothetical protein|nr:hypothetical protein [Luteolibacter sp.]
MAAKKTAKKSTESTPTKAPAAKKAAKKAVPAKSTPETGTSSAAKTAIPTIPVKPTAPKASTEAIARAAYLNYRRRVEQGLPGDSRGDWLEAERQLAK